MRKKHKKLKIGWICCLVTLPVLAIFALTGCANNNPISTAGMEPANLAALTNTAPVSDALSELLSTLKPLGYDGVGLEYESDQTLVLLNQIFSDPKSHNRKIRLMYTGVALSYDPKYESLTIGGGDLKEVVLSYIEKTIPARDVQ